LLQTLLAVELRALCQVDVEAVDVQRDGDRPRVVHDAVMASGRKVRTSPGSTIPMLAADGGLSPRVGA
jgi:hypothetical protein